MIAELFYPKELKEIIADLRAKDDLNEQALKALEHAPMVSFGVFLFVFIVSFLYLYPNFHAISWAGIVCAMGAFILNLLSIQTTACRMKAYIKGVRKFGVVAGIYAVG